MENLTERAIAWAVEEDKKKDSRLAKSDAERESFQGLVRRHGYWLSEEEKSYVEASVKANEARLTRERNLRRGAWAAAVVATISAGILLQNLIKTRELQQQQAETLEVTKQNDKEMRRQQSRLLARLANEAIGKNDIFSGARFALAGLDKIAGAMSLKSEASNALSAAAGSDSSESR